MGEKERGPHAIKPVPSQSVDHALPLGAAQGGAAGLQPPPRPDEGASLVKLAIVVAGVFVGGAVAAKLLG